MKTELTKKYIDLFKQQESEITLSSPTLMNKKRAQALSNLTTMGLPHFREESYQRFKIDQELSEERTLNLQETISGEEDLKTFSCRLTYPDAIQCFIIEGKVYVPKICDDFFLGSFSDLEKIHPDIAERYYNQIAEGDNDRLTTLNTLFATEALVYYIPKGVKNNQPIHLIHYSKINESNSPNISFPRILWIAEEDSKSVLLLCDHATKDSSCYVGAIEIFADKSAELEYYNIEETSSEVLRIFNTHVHQEKDSKVLIDNITIKNGKTRNNFYCNLNGENAHLDLDGLGILDDEQLVDNWTIIRHNTPNCQSDELFKYTLNDKSVGSFSGLIYVAPNAQKTQAYQNNRNLILADGAKMFSKPQLEIYADDVKCSHGMTTGELNKDAIFYLQQRSIPYVEAKLLLTIAFMSDVLEKIEFTPLRERLYTVIENRYRGLPGTCG